MKISKSQATRQDWDRVRSFNYKLTNLKSQYQSIVYAELDGDHGEVMTKDIEHIYFILEGSGRFTFNDQTTTVNQGDIITIPANTTYDYQPSSNTTLKVLLFMELWDN